MVEMRERERRQCRYIERNRENYSQQRQKKKQIVRDVIIKKYPTVQPCPLLCCLSYTKVQEKLKATYVFWSCATRSAQCT
jgi:hypothetical protein